MQQLPPVAEQINLSHLNETKFPLVCCSVNIRPGLYSTPPGAWEEYYTPQGSNTSIKKQKNTFYLWQRCFVVMDAKIQLNTNNEILAWWVQGGFSNRQLFVSCGSGPPPPPPPHPTPLTPPHSPPSANLDLCKLKIFENVPFLCWMQRWIQTNLIMQHIDCNIHLDIEKMNTCWQMLITERHKEGSVSALMLIRSYFKNYLRTATSNFPAYLRALQQDMTPFSAPLVLLGSQEL